jgi:hypothetical protein
LAISEFLGFLSLAGFVALVGQASWKTFGGTKDGWSFQNHGVDQLPKVLEFALQSCLNDGTIVIENRRFEHFVQFKKYIQRDRKFGLELGFPNADWSTKHSQKLRNFLTTNNIPFREKSENVGQVNSFTLVDCGQDINLAVRLARLCFLDVFGLASDVRFKSTVTDNSTVTDVVDDPDYVNPTASQWWTAWRSNQRAKGRPDPKIVLTGAALTMGQIICYPVLWVSAFLPNGDATKWEPAFQSVPMEGSQSTLMLFLIFCALCFGADRSYRRLARSTTLTAR